MNAANSQQENLNTPEEIKAKRRYYGKLFVFLIFVIIIFEYYVYVYEVMWKKLTIRNAISVEICMFIFHFLLLMMLWSLTTTMNTHPGEIPLYWGFYIGDADYKRKRYCLICNAFKPERSHHCSVCNVCVLNMDHHCPWVDNCIGFYNRKFFMQLLFYLCLLTNFMVMSEGYDIYTILLDIIQMKLQYDHKLIRYAIVIIAYGLATTLSVLVTMFFKYHLTLVLSNSTTIESLDKEHTAENQKFVLSRWENWLQVFGENYCLWFIPIMTEIGNPTGDGLTWSASQIDPRVAKCNNTGTVDANATPNQNNPGINKQNSDQNVEMKNYKSNYASNNYASTSPFSPPTPVIAY